ncbi:hypothetical protein QBC38DRAFT_505114 [Podospora fimiseda]|uniref:FAD dependent oxidoreductase domain-containing protein n=1 Tax=Podospora fimiseda TaxID=252190 RepID=A0AAN6YRN8_9PEZI|nr:hypothetical protein QBC38DRAFT_505114 [Podospora fimiseda]
MRSSTGVTPCSAILSTTQSLALQSLHRRINPTTRNIKSQRDSRTMFVRHLGLYMEVQRLSLQTMQEFRICWDGVTPTRDFIISPHSGVDSLFVATGGSFHGFKFLPIIGKYVVQMLSDELDPALQNKWAWEREVPAINGNDLLSLEYKSLMG